MLLRVKLMGKSAAFMRDMLLPGGSIPAEKWAEAFGKTEIIPKLLAIYGKRVFAAATRSVQDGTALPTLEKAMDDALLKPFTALRYDPLRIEPVVGYLLGAEREAAAVRLILAGKKNQFSQEAIEERLRDLYGE
jgi:V/A-type H+-transporting ATPase subunit C